MKKILHVSDVHASMHPTKGQSRIALERLRKAILLDAEVLQGVDSIIVSGDITYSGQKLEFKLFLDEVLNPIIEELKLNRNSVFFAPGNHDINREQLSITQKLAIGMIRESYSSENIRELQDEIFGAQSNPSKNWVEFISEFCKGSDTPVELNDLFQTYRHEDVGIVCLNTGWSAIGGDREKLFVGEHQIEKALKSVQSAKEKIVILHHPLEWLNPEERRVLAAKLSDAGVSAIFYGHMHEFNLLRESSFSEDFVLKLQAGRFDISGSENSGYSTISLNHKNNLKSGRITFRKFDKDTGRFVTWTDRSSNGYIDYESNPATGFDIDAFAEDCKKALEIVEFDLMCNIGVFESERKKLSDIFICPAIKVETYEIADEGEEKYIDFQEFQLSHECFLMVGGENSGKSTVLKKLVSTRLQQQSQLQLDEIVFYLDCKGRKFPSKHRIKSELSEVYESHKNSTTYIDVLRNKTTTENALLIFDGVDELDQYSLEQLFEFMKEFNKPRVIISCKHAAALELSTKTRALTDKRFVELNIGGMKRSHVKSLINKWVSKKDEKAAVAKEILKAVDNAGMPNNLFVYSMLLSIYERKQGNFSTYLHEADLVENFIEVIMHKHCITKQRAPQYKDLLRLLGAIAEKMQSNNLYTLKVSEMESLIVKFNQDIAQDFGVSSYLTPIISSGVVEEIECGYRFSQACFFDYAYARYLSSQKLDYADLHRRVDFLRFNKVIEYLSAISKVDQDLLSFCHDLTEHAWQLCAHDKAVSDLKSAAEELEAAAKSDILDLVKAETIEASLDQPPPKEHEVDARLDESQPLRVVPHNGESRANWEDLTGATLFQTCLSLYARVFRAAEHLSDRSFADLHFSRALEFYEKSIALNTRNFHEQLRPIVLRKLIEHSKYEALSPTQQRKTEENINAFLNFLIAAFPNFAVSMMSSDLVNSRQINRLKRKREDTKNNLEKIIITYSLCELEEIDTVSEIKSILPKVSYEYSSVIMKIIELTHLNFTISENDKKELLAHARSLLKDKSARKLVNDLSEISNKITHELLESAEK